MIDTPDYQVGVWIRCQIHPILGMGYLAKADTDTDLEVYCSTKYKMTGDIPLIRSDKREPG